MATAILASPTPIPTAERPAGIRYCVTCLAIYRQDFQCCPLDGGALVVASADPWVGSAIGDHYIIDGLVGQGAMGRVYRAHHRDIPDRAYAVKILIGDLAAAARMRARFQHEAEAASKLAHPNVVNVIDYGTTEHGISYIVMDLVAGPSLGEIVQRGPMSPERVIRLARQLCEGLEHAHSRGMVHRDFKPDNILVIGEGELEVARIADFGLALSLGSDVRLTTTGIVCTPAYAAPEQLRGEPIDHRVDLYALGTTMFEMLSGGILPFNTSDVDSSVRSKLAADAPSVMMVAPNVPPALVSIVGRLLASDPARRPRSARAVARALDAAIAAPAMPMQAEITARLRARPVGTPPPVTPQEASTPTAAAVTTVARRRSAPPPARIRRRASLGRRLTQLLALGLTLGGIASYITLRQPSTDELAGAADRLVVTASAPVELLVDTARTIPDVRPETSTVAMTVSVTAIPAEAPASLPVTAPPAPASSPAPMPVQAARAETPSRSTRARVPSALAQRQQRARRALLGLDRALGRENTADLWEAYRSIRLSDADDAGATLSMIESEVAARTPLP